ARARSAAYLGPPCPDRSGRLAGLSRPKPTYAAPCWNIAWLMMAPDGIVAFVRASMNSSAFRLGGPYWMIEANSASGFGDAANWMNLMADSRFGLPFMTASELLPLTKPASNTTLKFRLSALFAAATRPFHAYVRTVSPVARSCID